MKSFGCSAPRGQIVEVLIPSTEQDGELFRILQMSREELDILIEPSLLRLERCISDEIVAKWANDDLAIANERCSVLAFRPRTPTRSFRGRAFRRLMRSRIAA